MAGATILGTFFGRRGFLRFPQVISGKAYTLTCDAGSYTVTGQDAGLTVQRQVALDTGAYTVTGQDPTLAHGFTLAADAGSYAVTGQDPTLAIARALGLNLGSYTVTGLDADLTYTPVAGAWRQAETLFIRQPIPAGIFDI